MKELTPVFTAMKEANTQIEAMRANAQMRLRRKLTPVLSTRMKI